MTCTYHTDGVFQTHASAPYSSFNQQVLIGFLGQNKIHWVGDKWEHYVT